MNLNGLDDLFEAQNSAPKATGVPMELDLDDCEPDPEQPRKSFKEDELKSLAANIKDIGVKSPISVRPKPGVPGKYIINYGERRWRASRIAGKQKIPAFVDESHDAYAQMAENIHRSDLTPVEIGEWIVKRIQEFKESQQDIATRLQLSKTWVSHHAKIGNAPEDLRGVLKHKCEDYTALAELLKTFADEPDAVRAFAERQEKVTREDVTRFVESLKAPAAQSPDQSVGTGSAGVDAGEKSAVPPPSGNARDGDEDGGLGGDAAGERSNDGAAPKPAAPKAAPQSKKSDLAAIYDAQVAGGRDVDAILSSAGDEAALKVFRTLAKCHKKGRATGIEKLPVALAQGLVSGEFNASGEKLYAMLAFLDGALHNAEFDTERMKAFCFEPVNRIQGS